MCLSIRPTIRRSFACPSLSLSVCPSVLGRVAIRPSDLQFVWLSLPLSICLSVRPSVRSLSACPTFRPFRCPSVRLSVCPFILPSFILPPSVRSSISPAFRPFPVRPHCCFHQPFLLIPTSSLPPYSSVLLSTTTTEHINISSTLPITISAPLKHSSHFCNYFLAGKSTHCFLCIICLEKITRISRRQYLGHYHGVTGIYVQ